ncbi:hypothetical protein TRFO_30571 [Tritrichomonas foetus]|uniref:UBR-type domain-containing protein n=1 Tax=Tritrichomonas foetus TaxID=1144522 RepID=A0A1J4JXY3_9EUKA|nr:hypothetical protein TRFO_30571 [Tritrichomonas foetus]|eukprot:OHT02374.1 hypothetical protein TRFO_30571 [Tritrichomonas foetus]
MHFNLDPKNCSHPRTRLSSLKPFHGFRCITCENHNNIHEPICAGCAEKCHAGHNIQNAHKLCYFCACYENMFPCQCQFNENPEKVLQRKRPFSLFFEVDGKKMAMTVDNSHCFQKKYPIVAIEFEENCKLQQFIFDDQDNQEITCVSDPKYVIEVHKKGLWAANPTGRANQRFNFIDGRMVNETMKECFVTFVGNIQDGYDFLFVAKDDVVSQTFSFIYHEREENDESNDNEIDQFHDEGIQNPFTLNELRTN